MKRFWALFVLLFFFCSFGTAQTEKWSANLLTYLGGTSGNGDDRYSTDTVFDVQSDAEGNIYVFGNTTSNIFPTTENAWAKTHMFTRATYMAKFDRFGHRLLLCTYIPAALYGQAVSREGKVYLLLGPEEDASLNNATTPQLYYISPEMKEPARVDVGLAFYPWRVSLDPGGNLTLVGLTGNTQNGYAMVAQITPPGERAPATIVYQKTLFYCERDCLIRDMQLGPRGEIGIAWRWNPNTNAQAPITGDAMQPNPMFFSDSRGNVTVPIQNLLTIYSPLAQTQMYGTYFSAMMTTTSPKIMFQDSRRWHVGGLASELSFERRTDGTTSWVRRMYLQTYRTAAPLWRNGAVGAVATKQNADGSDSLVVSRMTDNGMADTVIASMNGTMKASAVFPLPDGRILFAGSTTAQDWGMGIRTYQRANAGGEDVFIGILNPNTPEPVLLTERSGRLLRPAVEPTRGTRTLRTGAASGDEGDVRGEDSNDTALRLMRSSR